MSRIKKLKNYPILLSIYVDDEIFEGLKRERDIMKRRHDGITLTSIARKAFVEWMIMRERSRKKAKHKGETQ